MKSILLVCVTVVCIPFAPLLAQQDTALPATEAQSGPSPALAATPAPQLIPADLLPAPIVAPAPLSELPTIPQLDSAFSPPPAPLATQQQRAHLEWRTLRNRLDNDPVFKVSRQKAEAASTDLEKRRLLRQHFEAYYARLIALASPEWKSYMNDRKTEVLNTLPQPRVRPSPAAEKKTP